MSQNISSNYSYWELKHFFKTWDLIVVGSGIVGLSTAISYKVRLPKHSVLILERGLLPSGASTKNAGFACFGSPGELLDDLSKMDSAKVWETVKMRWEGLKMLRERLGDKEIKYECKGGYELFFDNNNLQRVRDSISSLNEAMFATVGIKDCFKIAPHINTCFKGVAGSIINPHEGQIDSGAMMLALLQHAQQLGIIVLNGVEVKRMQSDINKVALQTSLGDMNCSRAAVAINGFARELLQLPEVKPARAQVLITSPLPKLPFAGTFHFNEGFFYFRDIDSRVLFGGGRNLDLENEYTSTQGLNQRIQDQLDEILTRHILPTIPFTVQKRWTGIMGVGSEKQPIIKMVSPRILAAVRMGGMGIAIGTWVGERASQLLAET